MGQYQLDLILDVLFLGFDRETEEKDPPLGGLGR